MSALVQQVAAASSSAAFGATPTNGNVVVVCAYCVTGTVTAVSCGSQPFALKETKAVGASGNVSIWSVVVSGMSSGVVSLTFSRGAPVGFNAQEYSGNQSSPDDQHSNASGTSNNPATGSITPTANSIVVACFAVVSGVYSSGPTNGFTRLTQVAPAGGILESAYKLAVSGAIATDETMTASVAWAALAMAYLEVATGHPAVKRMGGVEFAHGGHQPNTGMMRW